jgi:hypothetical protein
MHSSLAISSAKVRFGVKQIIGCQISINFLFYASYELRKDLESYRIATVLTLAVVTHSQHAVKVRSRVYTVHYDEPNLPSVQFQLDTIALYSLNSTFSSANLIPIRFVASVCFMKQLLIHLVSLLDRVLEVKSLQQLEKHFSVHCTIEVENSFFCWSSTI